MNGMKDKFRHFRLSSGMLMTVLLFLGIMLALFFLINSGILVPHTGDEDSEGETVGVLPELDSPGSTDVTYYAGRDMEPDELLAHLDEADSYLWIFRAVEAWENDYTVERAVITRQGEKYRIEKENLLVICDGERLYRREGMLETVCPANVSDLYTEAGLTSLENVQNSAGSGYNCTMEYDDPVNPKNIRISRSRDGYRDEFVVSIETGIPVTERSYVGSMAYRMILTDSLTVTDSRENGIFEIPDME